MGKQPPLAFTVSVPRGPIKKEIRLPVKIGNPGDPVEKAIKFEAIWDTGTTMSIISTAVLKRLKLTDVIDTITFPPPLLILGQSRCLQGVASSPIIAV